MRVSRLVLAAAILSAVLQFDIGAQQPTPQYRIQPLSDLTGAPGLSLALRKLTTVGTLMQITAHPDDEPNTMLALYARHFGLRVTLVTATRGDGGQNEIGPELFDALGILRTEELLGAHRFDGAEQYFTRAVDFGYSFSTQETFEKWGHDEILGDMVRHIRMIRPDVITSMSPEGTGGGQHHQASAMLAAEAFKAAGDPTKFPEQMREGLRPWQAKKLYRPAGGFGGGRGPGGPGGGRGGGRGAAPTAPDDATIATLDTNIYEPVLGCTIGEIGSVASGMHICQGRAPLVPPPGGGGRGGFGGTYRLVDTVLSNVKKGSETSLFEGIDVSLGALADYADKSSESLVDLKARLGVIGQHAARAMLAYESGGPTGAIPELVQGLNDVRELLKVLPNQSADAQSEIGMRVRLKEQQFQDALILAQGARLDATANDGIVIGGQSLNVAVLIGNRGAKEVAVRSVTLSGFEGPGNCTPGAAAPNATYECRAEVRIPRDARLTDVYWDRPEDAGRATFASDAPFGLPFRPTPFRARVEMTISGAAVTQDLPIQFRYEGAAQAGEKRMELNVVPAFSVSVAPRIAVVPLNLSAASANAAKAATAVARATAVEQRELRVTVINGSRGAAAATVRLKTPAGWRVTPSAGVPVTFSREDESTTTRFTIEAPSTVKAEDVEITAEVSADGGASYDTGYQVIEYPHIQRRHKLIPAVSRVKVIDVKVPRGLSVGYIMGVGDQVPTALQQLGAHVTMIESDELAWGDLSKYDAIVTGVRAYERRGDLRANNHRLLKYVEDGGTAIVQYNRNEFNQAQYGPYPAAVGQERITDERAPVKVLDPKNPVFTFPNRIADADWQNWVQERGTYFLGERDPKYVDLVEMEDPFEYNRGVKRGAFVEARYGKGRWLYVGLVLWRELPSGVQGAYRLFANLISLGKAPR
jgi:LmbE family N-acetylglucosaminyl deacetylase